MKQTTIRLDEKDQAAIAEIRDYYGVSSDIDAIRIALRETQRQIKKETSPTPAPQTSKGHSSLP
jgi:Arc/MetJ-type ribon-helix-helix transcriptional regulator